MITGQASIALNSSAHRCCSVIRSPTPYEQSGERFLTARYLSFDRLWERDVLTASPSDISAVPSCARSQGLPGSREWLEGFDSYLSPYF